MNRFERLLNSLVEKIESIRALCSDIPVDFAEAISVELGKVVKALRNPQACLVGRNVGYVAAEAEQAVRDLVALERRFLITCGTIQSFRDRIGNLHRETPLRMRVSDAITEYDLLRLNYETRTFELRQKFEELESLMGEAEMQSQALVARLAYERVRDTLVSNVVGAIKPSRRNKQKARAKSAEHRAFVVSHNNIRTA